MYISCRNLHPEGIGLDIGVIISTVQMLEPLMSGHEDSHVISGLRRDRGLDSSDNKVGLYIVTNGAKEGM
jgi:uncharacterized membrane protein (DUF441 family)